MLEAHLQSNKELWNNLTRVHVGSEFYDLEGFITGKDSLNEIDLANLGDVTGKSVLHLQCHFGKDTLSLARMGAQVTGVDLSDVAITKARELNDQLHLNARFINCDLNKLDEYLDEKFDIIFASFGVLGWHQDLEQFGFIVSHFLKQGGVFCLAEFHPVLWMFNNERTAIEYCYFKGEPIIEEKMGSYADPTAKNMGTSYCWNHSLGEVFAALEGNGLSIHGFKEYDYPPFDIFNPRVEKGGRFYV